MAAPAKKKLKIQKQRAMEKHATSVQERMWKKAAPLYGQQGKPRPRTKYAKPGSDEELFAGYYEKPGDKRGQGEIVLPDWAVKRVAGHGKAKDVDAARRLVMHEWAHRYQGKGVNTGVKAEGGAEAHAREMSPSVMKQLGWKYRQRETGKDYGRDVRQVVKKKGRRWVEKGQFR